MSAVVTQHYLLYILISVLVQTQKNMFFQNFVANFLLFAVKKVKIGYFDQHFGCAAPKHWLKYTTIIEYA